MAEPFLAEIRIYPFAFAPLGWAHCDGQLLPISQHTALFSLLGTNYGGDGKATFALPDLRGAAPMHPGQGPGLSDHVLGEAGGTEMVTLTEAELPEHTHAVQANSEPAHLQEPAASRVLAASSGGRAYRKSDGVLTQLAPEAVAPSGGSQPHNNMQPFTAFRFNIALQGVYPPRG